MKLPTLGLLLLAPIAAGCRSAEPPSRTVHPYRVVLLPVEGAGVALAEPAGPDDLHFAMPPEELEAAIENRIAGAGVFSDVVLARPADLAAARAPDAVAAAVEVARRTASDLIVRVQVKSARLADLGNNGSTFWSTLTWTVIPLPIWSVNDRTYDTNLAVQVELYDPSDAQKPTASIVASSGKQDLDLWDRGLSWWVPIVPPPFLKGSPKTVSAELTRRALAQLLDLLVDELRKREIPSRFEMSVDYAGPSLKVSVSSRRRLRWISVDSAGSPLRLWAENELAPDADSTADAFVYRRTIELRPETKTAVRITAEDETGGREVRTLLVAGATSGK